MSKFYDFSSCVYADLQGIKEEILRNPLISQIGLIREGERIFYTGYLQEEDREAFLLKLNEEIIKRGDKR